jgi:hypothetical protein
MYKNNVETIIYIMDSDEIYKAIGYIVVIIFFIYVISKIFRLNTRIIEGFDDAVSNKKDNTSTNKKSSSNKSVNQEDIKKEIDKLIAKEKSLKDYLQIYIRENKDNYGTLMDSLYNITNYRMIKLVLETSDKVNNNPDSGETKAALEQINNMKEFMNTLTYTYKTLDNLSKSDNSSSEESGSTF